MNSTQITAWNETKLERLFMDKNRCCFCNKKLDVAYPIYMHNPVTRLYTTIYICKACDDEYWYGSWYDARRAIRKLVFSR